MDLTLFHRDSPISTSQGLSARALRYGGRSVLRYVRQALLIAAASVAVPPPAIAELPMTGTYVPEFHDIDLVLQDFFASNPIPGGTMTITRNNEVVYERGIGFTDALRTVPMQETAMMRLASVTKPFTASAIQQLASDGVLNLNSPVFNIVGNGGVLSITPYNGVLGDWRLKDITIQHLLRHEGGWNRNTAGDLTYRDIEIANIMGIPSPPGIANTAQYILSQPLQFTPGSDANYSNVGYMFLGMVIEAVSGQPHMDYLNEKVLAPAGIPDWEVAAGRTFASDQNPREPEYVSDSGHTATNVYDPSGPKVARPYGGWDHEKRVAIGGLIASSKAVAVLAGDRIANGPAIGTLRSDYPYTRYKWNHGGALDGTNTRIRQAQDAPEEYTYAILLNKRPASGPSYTGILLPLIDQVLDNMTEWPQALVYRGDFNNDQWLTGEDVVLFKHALAMDCESTFILYNPLSRYAAGDFDGDGHVNWQDLPGFIATLQHAGVPEHYIALLPSTPGWIPFSVSTGLVTQAEQDYPMVGGTNAVIKDGYGTVLFDALNTYTGETRIEAGTLALAATGSIAESLAISVASNGALDVTALAEDFTLGSGKAIGGRGTVVGSFRFGAAERVNGFETTAIRN